MIRISHQSHELFSVSLLFLLIYSVPLPVATWNNIIFVKVMCGIRVGAGMAMRDFIMVIGCPKNTLS